MKRIIFIIVAVLLAVNSFAQAPSFQWAKSIGSTMDDGGNAITVDVWGNVYTTGYFSGTADFDPGPGIYNLTGTGGLFISKLDALGNFVWAKQIVGAGGMYTEKVNKVQCDGSGNIYISGDFVGTVDFDPGPGTFTLHSLYTAAFFLKLDVSGNFLFASSFSQINIQSSTITIDESGNSYIAFYYWGSDSVNFSSANGSLYLGYGGVSGGTDGLLISKLDPFGNLLWVKKIECVLYNVTPINLSIGNSGNIFLVGIFSDTVDFDPGPAVFNLINPSSLNALFFLLKLDSAGNFIWAVIPALGIQSFTMDMAIDASENLYFTGHPNSIGSVITKINGNGNLVWSKTLVGANSMGRCICTDVNGNIYSSGVYNPLIDLDPGAGTCTFNIPPAGGRGFYISKLDSVGNFVWGTSVLTSYGVNGWPISISADSYGNAYLTAFYASPTITCGPLSVANVDNSGTTTSTTDIFILKIAPTQKVWPGDANGNLVADNSDLLPIGLYYGQTGIQRTVQGNVWQADSCADWGALQTNGFDIKHADCNGDGTIDANDTLAINQNFNLIHAIPAHCNNDEKTINPDIYFVTSGGVYNPGDMVDVEVWAGSSAMPVSGLYG